MPELYYNKNNFKIIKLTCLERDILEFGNICGSCNTEISDKDDAYYVAVLNELFCKDCVDDIIKGLPPVSNKEDKVFEERHYNYVMQELDINNILEGLESAKVDNYLATIEAHDIDNL